MSQLVNGKSDQSVLMRLLAEWNAFQNGPTPYPFTLNIGADNGNFTSLEVDGIVCGEIVVGAETLSESDVALINAILASAAEINALAGTGVVADDITKLHAITASAAELNVLDEVTAGTVAASKAVVVDSNKDIGVLRYITSIGAYFGTNGASGAAGSFVVRDGGSPGNEASISYSDIVKIDAITNGTAAAGKAVVLDANKRVDEVVIGTLKLGAGAGTAVTATAAELNVLDDIATYITGGGTHNSHHSFISGITSSASELNVLDGIGVSAATHTANHEFLSQVTATAAELNLLDNTTGYQSLWTADKFWNLGRMPWQSAGFFDWTSYPSLSSLTSQNYGINPTYLNGFLNDIVWQLDDIMWALKGMGLIQKI